MFFLSLVVGDILDAFRLLGESLAHPAKLLLVELLDTDKLVLSLRCEDEFVKLCLQGFAVAAFCKTNTIKNVMIVVPVLMTSCHVSE